MYKSKNDIKDADLPIKESKTEKISNYIRKDDQYFSDEKLLKWSEDAFLKICKAFANNNYDWLHIFESNRLFEKHKNKICENIANGYVQILDQTKFVYNEITDYKEDEENEILEIELHCITRDYDNQAVINVLQYKDWKEKFLLTLIRKKGTKTNKEELDVKRCPNCNASNGISFIGKCEHCNQVISTGEYRWVLDDIKKISKKNYYNLK